MGAATSTAAVASALLPPRLLGRKRPRPGPSERDGEKDDDEPQYKERRPKRRRHGTSSRPPPIRLLDVPLDCLALVASFLPLDSRARLGGTCRTLRRCEAEDGAFVRSRERRIRRVVAEVGVWIRFGSFEEWDRDSSDSEGDDDDANDGDEADCRPLVALLSELDGPWGIVGLFRVARLAAPLDRRLCRGWTSEGEVLRRDRGARHVCRVAGRWLPGCPRGAELAAEAYGWIERPDWDEEDADELREEVLRGELPRPIREVLRQELEAAFVLHLLGRHAFPYLWRFLKEGFKCRYRYLRRLAAIL